MTPPTEPKNRFEQFMDERKWSPWSNPARRFGVEDMRWRIRERFNGKVVEILELDDRFYQPILTVIADDQLYQPITVDFDGNGIERGGGIVCDTWEEAKRFAWSQFQQQLQSPRDNRGR